MKVKWLMLANRLLMGLLIPREGTSRVLGIDPVADEVAVKSRVGYVPEKYGFYEYMRVKEIIGFIAAYHADWNIELQQQLIADFAKKDPFDVGPLHGVGALIPYGLRGHGKLAFVLLIVLGDQAEEELFQVGFFMLPCQIFERAFGQNVAAVQDGNLVAQTFGFAHDVCREDDALALVA